MCGVHRAQLGLLHGAWEEAERTALPAAHLDSTRVDYGAEAWYVVAESRRLRGAPGATEAYGEAHARGRNPPPGRALLRPAEGRAEEALAVLSDGCRRWQELGATYDAAGVRGRLAQAYRAIGDEASAAEETALAQATFDRLGSHRPAPQAPEGLTTREREVLALVSEGCSNRQIGQELFISDRTVARHLTNIFHKIVVPVSGEWSIAPTRHTRRPSQHEHQTRRATAPPPGRTP